MADITSAISLEELNKRFAQIGYDEEAMQKQLDAEIAKSKVKFVVLDDDPTGVQTVHDITVFTDWTVERVSKRLHA